MPETYKCLKQKPTHSELVKMKVDRNRVIDQGFHVVIWRDKEQTRIDIIKLKSPFDIYSKPANTVARNLLKHIGITESCQCVARNKQADIVLRTKAVTIAELIMLGDV